MPSMKVFIDDILLTRSVIGAYSIETLTVVISIIYNTKNLYLPYNQNLFIFNLAKVIIVKKNSLKLYESIPSMDVDILV